MLQAHDQVLGPAPSCGDCGSEFSTKETLAKHLRKKPCRKCKKCGEWCASGKELSRHQEIHDSDDSDSRRDSKARHHKIRRQSSDSSLSSPESDLEDELAGVAQNSSELVKTRRKKFDDVSKNDMTEHPRNRSTRSASPKQERSRTPAHGRDLLDYRSNELVSPGQLASPTRPAPDSSDPSQSLSQSQLRDVRHRVFNSPTPQESPQRARNASGARNSIQATSDEILVPNKQSEKAREMKGKRRERTEVQNSSFEDDTIDSASSNPEIKTDSLFKDKVSFKLKSQTPSSSDFPSTDHTGDSRPNLQPPLGLKSGSRSVFSGKERGMRHSEE
ncbi:hypothetical protein VTL71DRAFT_16508 [Oculimacula yallundae]|uniref:C2H2-type domain-containing protein n=1 Tax=Oculimacula yallundae TaxID=86028 RepID=A0ABR4CF91_9HELO